MESAFLFGLRMRIVSQATRLVKLPEWIGWGMLSSGIMIMASSALPPWLQPSGVQLALYAIGIGLIVSTAAWQISSRNIDPQKLAAAPVPATKEPAAMHGKSVQQAAPATITVTGNGNAINTGINHGMVAGTVNMGPQPRHLTADDKAAAAAIERGEHRKP